MNRIMFTGSLVGIALFVCLLLLTYFAQAWFKDFARDYINRRIEPTITRGVAAIEREVLPDLADHPDTVNGITAEIVRYRADPIRYIDAITSGRLPVSSQESWLAKAAESLKKTVSAKASLPQAIGDHFRRVFEHLILDLRIFSITNIVAFAVVAGLMRGYDARSPRLVVQAFIPFLATCYSLTVYIKQDWFFNLLLDFHMGAAYPFILVMTALDLWNRWHRGQLRKRASQIAHEMVAG